MRNLVPITRPMGAADLTQAAEDAGKLALALSDLAHGVAAYEAATGAAIAVVDADKVVTSVVWPPEYAPGLPGAAAISAPAQPYLTLHAAWAGASPPGAPQRVALDAWIDGLTGMTAWG